MCGIVGYIGEKQAYDILIKGLQRLEYRGYDSAGIALFDGKNLKISKTKGNKTETASLVGKKLAEKAVSKGIKQVSFDRSGYLYHGRVKSLADGAREGGLKF